MASKTSDSPHMTRELRAAIKPGLSHLQRTGHGVTKQDEFPTSQRCAHTHTHTHTNTKARERRGGGGGDGEGGATN